MRIREPAVAGTFYSANPAQLRSNVTEMLQAARIAPVPVPSPDHQSLKALIVPHAGYIYSGPIAASAYKLLVDLPRQINRVLLLGPSHRVPLRGIAMPDCDFFRSPLGDIAIDSAAASSISDHPEVQISDQAHALEHSLEVHLPFLQTVLHDFLLLPLVVGITNSDVVAQLLNKLWGGDETLIIISSDLSHFLTYACAKSADKNTSDLIEALDDSITGEQACGCFPLNGLLKLAQQRDLQIETLDLRNSGDTAGSHDSVVGYGSYAVYEKFSHS